MTEQLRDALVRVADDAPPVDLPDDLWTRGRRARRQGRALVVGAVACLVLAVFGLTTVVTGRAPLPQPVAPTRGEPGVPDAIAGVPDWLVQLVDTPTGEVSWAPELDAVTDLAVGRAAAALAVGTGGGQLPLVVTADEGRYLPLVLPGYSDAATINSGLGESSALALSADGWSLAYAWWDPRASVNAPMPAGVRIVDLRSGAITEVALTGSNGVDVDRLSFSPNGRYVSWTGTANDSWTPMSRGGGDLVAGAIDVAAGTSRPLPLPRQREYGAAVSSAGVAALWDGQTVLVDDDGDRSRYRVPRAVGGRLASPRFSADGRLLALSTDRGGLLPVLDLSTGRARTLDAPGGMGELVAAAGWTADGQVATTFAPGYGQRASVLGLVDPTQGRWTGQVGSLDPDGVAHVELATGLMTRDRPTVERDEPDWPWSTTRRVTVGAVGGTLVLLGGLAVWLRRRWWAWPAD